MTSSSSQVTLIREETQCEWSYEYVRIVYLFHISQLIPPWESEMIIFGAQFIKETDKKRANKADRKKHMEQKQQAFEKKQSYYKKHLISICKTITVHLNSIFCFYLQNRIIHHKSNTILWKLYWA